MSRGVSSSSADSGQVQAWTVEIWEDNRGNAPYVDWMNDLSKYEQAVVTAAVRNVLQPLGMGICDTEWGKPLGDGLYEFRIRLALRAIMTWGKPADDEPPTEISGRKVLLRIFLTFHGSKIILLFHGYDKGKDPSERRQQKEIKKARKALASWKGQR